LRVDAWHLLAAVSPKSFFSIALMLGGELAVALSFICLKFKVQVSAEGVNPEVKKKH